jgi:Ca2+:H+ antiporter
MMAVEPGPISLSFGSGGVLTVLPAVLITGQVAGDGRSDWLKRVQLLAVYVILGLAYFFLPARG